MRASGSFPRTRGWVDSTESRQGADSGWRVVSSLQAQGCLLIGTLWACGGGADGSGGDGAAMTGGTTAPAPAQMPVTPAPMPSPMPPPAPFCGDGRCDVWEMETAATCPADCGPRCMEPCGSDADCGPGEMCASLSDGR